MGSCAIKAAVVSADEKEKGLRMILNFGHTVGHAVETASQYRIPHGRAVGIGMLAETRIGVRTGTTPPAVLAQLEDLMARMGVRIGALPSSKILLPLIRKDKKNTRSADMKEPEIPLILPVTLGRVKVRSFTPKEIGRHLD
jgi:3-dehydroquinate synthase